MNPESLFFNVHCIPEYGPGQDHQWPLDFKIQKSFSIFFLLISSIWWLITPSTSKCILFKIHTGFSSSFTSHSSLLVSSQLAHPYFSDLQGVPLGSVFLPLSINTHFFHNLIQFNFTLFKHWSRPNFYLQPILLISTPDPYTSTSYGNF